MGASPPWGYRPGLGPSSAVAGWLAEHGHELVAVGLEGDVNVP